MTRRNDMTMGFMTSLPADFRPVPGVKGRGPSGTLDTAKITSKGQVTLPKTVRTALGVAEGDLVRFSMVDGRIVVEVGTSDEEPEDPAVAAFLDTLEGSIASSSDFPVEMMQTMKALTAGIAVDLDEPIEDDVVI
ncbi:transcriptional regulator, AbrB family [Roseivivax marinus]|uniref:type II toxin-antitoxin system PrlF family antitoxin n=1 Tax=Roseivivax marinus TaxID=1379903 RepID=UPI0008CD6D3A|nr:type II toxin-antitoxin system PrlF family antitoxin [Roseivivax marinus]SEL61859.1 transcriptional regulator, AbrB family [Roseivivax marinus]